MFSFKLKHGRISSYSPSLLLCITLLFPLKLLGADQVPPDAVQAPPETTQAPPHTDQSNIPKSESDSFDSVEAPRDYLSEKIVRFASYIDNFFGGNRHYQESNQSVMQLDLTKVMGYGSDNHLNLAAGLNLKLPVTEGRFRLWLETDPENNITDEHKKDTTTLQAKAATPKSVALAARFATVKNEVWSFNTDAGVKFPITRLTPFVRATAGYAASVRDWRLRTSESAYWFNTLGVGETTQIDLDNILTPVMLFRSSSTATWLKDTHNFDLGQSFSVYHTLNDRSALIYQVGGSWVSYPYLYATDYVTLVFYRYRVHQNWLFLELSPQLHFPMDKDYKASPAFSMRLEALFDGSR